jgi:hypothetical protein
VKNVTEPSVLRVGMHVGARLATIGFREVFIEPTLIRHLYAFLKTVEIA